MPIFLKANHQLESRMPEIGQSGSEGGAKFVFVPTPISYTTRLTEWSDSIRERLEGLSPGRSGPLEKRIARP